MSLIWAGIDIGKTHHHCVVLDASGSKLLSRRVANGEPELLKLLGDVLALGDEVTWAIDVVDGIAALLIAVLLNHGQRVVHIPGLAVNRATVGYRGQGKTDARDASVIADQARMRRDLSQVRPADEITTELKLLTTRRADLVEDRTRAINRLRGLLTGIFPALERALDLTNNGPLVLLTGYQTPAALRGMGAGRLETWLKNRKVRRAAAVAQAAVDAANRQHTSVVGEKSTAQMVATMAAEVLALNAKVVEIDKLIQAGFHAHELAEVISSLPGMGTLLGAEFLAVTGGDMDAFGSADRLASFAGLAPVPRDSGRISGNLHRPHRYNRRLQRVFYLSAFASLHASPDSRRFYDRKRAEGKRHAQAVIALARRRVNVLWALLRDRRCYQPSSGAPAAA